MVPKTNMARNDSDKETLGHSNENSSVRDGGEKGEREPQETGPVWFWDKICGMPGVKCS